MLPELPLPPTQIPGASFESFLAGASRQQRLNWPLPPCPGHGGRGHLGSPEPRGPAFMLSSRDLCWLHPCLAPPSPHRPCAPGLGAWKLGLLPTARLASLSRGAPAQRPSPEPSQPVPTAQGSECQCPRCTCPGFQSCRAPEPHATLAGTQRLGPQKRILGLREVRSVA